VVVKGAFSASIAKDVRESAWRELEDKGIVRDDTTTWSATPYVRTGGDPQFHVMASRGDAAAQAQLPETTTRLLSEVAPRALGAQLDMVRGNVTEETVAGLEIPGSCAVNLCRPVDGEVGAASPGVRPSA
jgi:hypothetical protein